MMPMLAFSNARSGYIYRKLSAINRLEKFCKAAPFIHIHLQRKLNLLLREIGQIRAVKFLCK